jgi:hypothetical protein
MRCVRFGARGVLVLTLVLALGAPVSALPRGEREPEPRNPITRILKFFRQIVCGDGVIIPVP